MDTAVQEERLRLRSEAELASEEARKAEEVKAKAIREAELADEAATDAREFAFQLAIETREAAQEGKIKARQAKQARRAALVAERKAKVLAKLAKKVSDAEMKSARYGGIRNQTEDEQRVEVEGSRALEEDSRTSQGKAELVEDIESIYKDLTGEEMEPVAESSTQAEENIEKPAKIYENKINLLLMPPVDVLQAKSIEEELRKIHNLRVLLTGGSLEGGVRIIVAAEPTAPLADILGHLPMVERVTKDGKDLQISLKTR